nr:hypothetical protein [Tanacetum cinerariifolium]
MGDEHLDIIPAMESDEVIKSCVENLVPNPSESEGENGCDVPSCFTTFSNILFDDEYEFDSIDDQSLHNEDFLEKIFSNLLFEEEIISIRINQHYFNAESDLVESMLNRDSLIISSSSKIDSLLDEFAGELTLLKSIPLGIDKTDCHPENEIHETSKNHALVADEEEVPTKYALMAKSGSSSDDEVYDESFCSKPCRKNTENLNTKTSKLNEELSDCETDLYNYKRGAYSDSSQVPTVSTDVAAASLSYDTVFAFIATQPNGSQMKYKDISQIDDDDIKKMDLKWNLALLSMRVDRFLKKTSKKITIQGSNVPGFNNQKWDALIATRWVISLESAYHQRVKTEGRERELQEGS